MLSSSRPPLARMLTSLRPPSSRMRRTLLDSAVRSPLSSRTLRTMIPSSLQPWRKRNDLLGGSFGVIRIDQNRQVLRT